MEFIIVKENQQLDDCLGVRREVFIEEQGVSEDEEIDEMDRLGSSAHHVLVKKDGAAVGTGRLKPYDPETAKFQRIAVKQRERGSGVGRAVVLEMERLAKELGYTYAILDAQCHAEQFYKKLGYVTVSPETFLDAGIPHVRMKKTLEY
jgi:predicted GNAT family N-acyltransferase